MVPYETSPYMGCPYMPKVHIWLAYMHVMYGPLYDFLPGKEKSQSILYVLNILYQSVLFWLTNVFTLSEPYSENDFTVCLKGA